MNYLFTAAGRGSRFLKAGLKPPKPLIRVFGIELLIWSMNSFKFIKEDKIYIASLKKHRVKERLEIKLKNLYPDNQIFWLELEEILNGQLLTAIEAISNFNILGPLIIHNCDTSYECDLNEINLHLEKKNFGIIPCFKAKGDNWSFAKSFSNDKNRACEVKEKIRISDNCSVGTYVFSSTKSLVLLYEEYFKKINEKEYYIAPIYQYALEKNMIVKISNAKSVKTFGTPQELLNSFNINFNELLGENGWDANQTKTLVVDIDNTICKKSETSDYSQALPISRVCEALRLANSQGVYIILFTSRNMRTFKGSMGLINKITAPILIKWLADNNIPYDEIYFGKPWGNAVSYIDDKALSIEKFIKN